MCGLDILFAFNRWKCMFVEKFQILLGEKTRVDMLIRATRVRIYLYAYINKVLNAQEIEVQKYYGYIQV